MHLESGTIRFMGKGGKERLFQNSEPSVCKLLKQYYEAHKIESQKCGYFFVNQRGGRFTKQFIRIMLKKYTKQDGIEKENSTYIMHSVIVSVILLHMKVL